MVTHARLRCCITIQPNDLQLVCVPIDLSDQAAAQRVDFLHELSDATGWPRAIERHYCEQLP